MSMNNRGTERSHKYTGAEGSQIGYIEIHQYPSRCKENSFTNGNCYMSLMYSQNGENLKQDFIRHMQRDLGPLATKWNQIYSRVPTWGFVSKSRFSVSSMKYLSKRNLKPQVFQTLCN